MSWLEFIAALADALAWPVAVVVLAVVFRARLHALLDDPLRRLRAGPLELEWDRQLSEAKVDLGDVDIRDTPAGPPAGSTAAELEPLARRSPVAAVLAAFARVEDALRRQLAPVVSGAELQGLGAVQLARLGRERGVVNDKTVRAVEGVAVMRNLAAHNPQAADLSVESAVEYLALIDGVVFAIDQGAAGKGTR